MPSPVALATKEEEDRRAWVTSHHEVVKLVKECFGDRFSNNEIFDRLKISRRTGYRALGNDERIGKAPGRKPKILESTIRDMIDYIESGGCNDVGNVWKHLAEKFAPDCNPKTVQDAVKKSGFKNHRNTVKLEPLMAEPASEGQQGPMEDDQIQQHLQQSPQQAQPLQQVQQVQQVQHIQPTPQNVIDPAFQHLNPADPLRSIIENAPDGHIRFALFEICSRYHEVAQVATSILYPYVAQAPPGASMGAVMTPQVHHSLQVPNGVTAPPSGGKRQRLAMCRRCNQQYDRAENNMENRSCLYHKGSPQKISPDAAGPIEQSPEAYIWSCCGGNGMVRGCCRAMHTTKKKRKYGKKRTADEAGLDGEEGDETGGEEETMVGNSTTQLGDPNIDASLQDLQPQDMAVHHLSMQMAAQMAAPQVNMQHHLSEQDGMASMQESLQEAMHGAMQQPTTLPPEMQLQLAASLVTGSG